MSEAELQARVEAISWEDFSRLFEHHARFNGRLTRAAGRFLPATLNLEFSSRLFAQYDAETQDNIIKHELTHYHLYRAHRGFQHRDADFKQLLAQVGGTRFAPVPEGAAQETYYVYQCRRCGQRYPRRRRINTQRYACSQCRGKLTLIGENISQEMLQRKQ